MTTSPTPKPSTGGFDAAAIAKVLKDSATNSSNKSTRAGGYDNSTMINIAGIPLPSGAFPAGVTQMSGKDLAIALEKMASGAVKSTTSQLDWETIKNLMARTGYYGNKPPSYKSGPMTKADKTAINNWVNAFAPSYSNPVAGQTVPSIWNLASTAAQSAVTNGSGATRLKIANVTVPNTLDLKSIADSAFRSALGRPPTAKEANKFAASYQQQVMAVAGSNAVNQAEVQQSNFDAMNGAKTPSSVTPNTVAPQMSTSTHPQTISAPTPESNNLAGLKSIPAQTSHATAATLNFRQDTPNAQVAATDFARKSAPAEAGAENVGNALNAMFSSLARNSQ